jgi:hypothetical protein
MPQVYKGGGDRIREELRGFLILPESERKQQWFEFFVEKGLHRLIDTSLPHPLDLPVSPEQISVRVHTLEEQLGSLWQPHHAWEIYLAFILLGLPEDRADSAMHRLGLTRSEIEVVEKSFRLMHENVICPLKQTDPAPTLYDTFYNFPMAAACVGIILSPQFETNLEAFVRYKRDLASVKLEVTGDDIIKMGVPQGEHVGKLLKSLLHAKLQGKVHHRVDEISWLKKQLAGQPEESRTG